MTLKTIFPLKCSVTECTDHWLIVWIVSNTPVTIRLLWSLEWDVVTFFTLVKYATLLFKFGVTETSWHFYFRLVLAPPLYRNKMNKVAQEFVEKIHFIKNIYKYKLLG